MDWNGLLGGFCLPIAIAMGEKANEIDRPSPCRECGKSFATGSLSEELISKRFFIQTKEYKSELIKNFNPDILNIFKNKKLFTANSLIIASEYINAKFNNEYSFLVEQRNQVFDEVYQSIVAELNKKYGKPAYSNFSKNKIQSRNNMETKWKIQNKNLYLIYYFDYSKNNDFGYMIELIYK